MKTLRSRFRLISLALVSAFLLALLLCANAAGKLPALPEQLSPSPSPEAGNTDFPEETSDLSESTPPPAETDMPSPAPAEEYNTYGL